MKNDEQKAERSDYDYKKENSISRLAVVFEQILRNFPGEENNRIREDIANYTIGYLGVSFGLHIKR